MKKIDAENLWDKIINYADSVGYQCGEGNSGEFSTQEDAETAEKELILEKNELITTFSSLTGWVPYYNEGTHLENYQDSGWSFTKAKRCVSQF